MKIARVLHNFLLYLCVALFDVNPYDFVERRRKKKLLKANGDSKLSLNNMTKGAPERGNAHVQYLLGQREQETHFTRDGDSRAG
jgi:hypothetical protein